MILGACDRSGTPELSVAVTDNCKQILRKVGLPSDVKEDARVRIAKLEARLIEADRRIEAGADCIDLVAERYRTAGE
jgi:rRNA-processing protein FCF1